MEIFFCKGKTLGAKIISEIDGGDCSHVAIASPEIGTGKIVAHSTARGVQIDHLKTFLSFYKVVRWYSIPINNEAHHLLELLESHANKPYDYLALMYLGLWKMGILRKKENIWQNRNFYICTEFASLAIFGKAISTYGLVELEAAIIERGYQPAYE
jgi:hypothetical protein